MTRDEAAEHLREIMETTEKSLQEPGLESGTYAYRKFAAGLTKDVAAIRTILTKGYAPPDKVILPREPTEAMLRALHVTPDMAGANIIRYSIDKLPGAYRAMLSAADKETGQ